MITKSEGRFKTLTWSPKVRVYWRVPRWLPCDYLSSIVYRLSVNLSSIVYRLSQNLSSIVYRLSRSTLASHVRARKCGFTRYPEVLCDHLNWVSTQESEWFERIRQGYPQMRSKPSFGHYWSQSGCISPSKCVGSGNMRLVQDSNVITKSEGRSKSSNMITKSECRSKTQMWSLKVRVVPRL